MSAYLFEWGYYNPNSGKLEDTSYELVYAESEELAETKLINRFDLKKFDYRLRTTT